MNRQMEYRDPRRPTRQQSLMDTAYIWAQRSTCSRLHVGCVFAKDGRVLVQGYNGAPAGLPHCDHSCTCRLTGPAPDFHHEKCASLRPCTIAVHAEQNAISFAAKYGVELRDSELFVTHQPCLSCAQSIINTGVQFVAYQEPYRLKEGLELLTSAGIEVMGGLWPQADSVIG